MCCTGLYYYKLLALDHHEEFLCLDLVLAYVKK
jgi:hypothetical protein